MYAEFFSKLKQEINKGLPGWEFQKKMAPPGRSLIHYEPGNSGKSRESGVMLWLYPTKNKIFIRLILRTEGGVHSGQVAFPGGQVEPGDGDFWNTALREAKEEVGLQPDQVTYLSVLTALYIPPSDFWVHPFIGTGEYLVQGLINKAEVQSYFDVDIMQLLQPALKTDAIITLGSGAKMKVPSYTLNGHIVWGATAMILSELEELIRRTGY